MSTAPLAVGMFGAVYSPWGVIVPTMLLPPGMEFTYHSTVVLLLLETTALSCRLLPAAIVVATGVTRVMVGVTTCELPPPQPASMSSMVTRQNFLGSASMRYVAPVVSLRRRRATLRCG